MIRIPYTVLPTRPKFRNSAEIRYFWPMKFQKISATKFWSKTAKNSRNFNIWQKLAKIRQKLTQKCLKFQKKSLTFPNQFCESLRNGLTTKTKFLVPMAYLGHFFNLKFFKKCWFFFSLKKKLSHKNAIKMEGRVKIWRNFKKKWPKMAEIWPKSGRKIRNFWSFWPKFCENQLATLN